MTFNFPLDKVESKETWPKGFYKAYVKVSTWVQGTDGHPDKLQTEVEVTNHHGEVKTIRTNYGVYGENTEWAAKARKKWSGLVRACGYTEHPKEPGELEGQEVEAMVGVKPDGYNTIYFFRKDSGEPLPVPEAGPAQAAPAATGGGFGGGF